MGTQRLESMARSPIYAHFSETLVGATTIRAYGQQERFRAANRSQLDANVAAYFTGTSANRWLAVRLETLGAAVTTASAAFAVLARRSSDPAFPALAGLSIATALAVTQSLNWLIRMSSGEGGRGVLRFMMRCHAACAPLSHSRAHARPPRTAHPQTLRRRW